MRYRGSRRLVVGGTLLAAGLFAAPHATYAHISVCRNDPIIWLDNNTKVQISAQISTDQNNVQAVHFTVHLPSGVHIQHVVYTQGKMRHLESFAPVYDSAANTYGVDTLVAAKTTATVVVTEQVVDPVKSTKVQAQGTTNTTISTSAQG